MGGVESDRNLLIIGKINFVRVFFQNQPITNVYFKFATFTSAFGKKKQTKVLVANQ